MAAKLVKYDPVPTDDQCANKHKMSHTKIKSVLR